MENKAIIALDHLKQLISADEIGGLSQDPSRSWDRTRILKEIVAAIEGCAEASGGGGGGDASPIIVNKDGLGTLDKTWKEIKDANKPVVVKFHVEQEGQYSDTYEYVTGVNYDVEDGYFIEAISARGDSYYVCDTENDYPVFDDDDGPVV